MQEVLISFGWYKYEDSKGGCCGGPKSRWKKTDLSGVTITVLTQRDFFIVRRLNRVIHSDNAHTLEEYLAKIV